MQCITECRTPECSVRPLLCDQTQMARLVTRFRYDRGWLRQNVNTQHQAGHRMRTAVLCMRRIRAWRQIKLIRDMEGKMAMEDPVACAFGAPLHVDRHAGQQEVRRKL